VPKIRTRVARFRHPFLRNKMVAPPVFYWGTQHNLPHLRNGLNSGLLHKMSMEQTVFLFPLMHRHLLFPLTSYLITVLPPQAVTNLVPESLVI
jgi:hypothetical protein